MPKKKSDEAMQAMRAAADAEDRTDKHVVTPGPIIPARELLGSMLLQQGNPRAALGAIESTLQKEPNRLGAILGAGKAAQQIGDRPLAVRYYRSALALAEDGEKPSRRELLEARTFLSRSSD